MDIFEGRYLNLNRKLLMLLGQWPYGSKSYKILRGLIMLTMFVVTMPYLISAIVNHEDVDRLMLNMLAFLTATVMFLKMFAMSIAEDKMKRMYKSIADNWLTIRDENDRAILIQYSERGRLLTLLYTVSISIAGGIFILSPLTPKILDKIIPLENPRPNLYILEGEYFVDREEYYMQLFSCDSVISALVTIITITADTMYISAAEHCCALNAIISYRLKNLGQESIDYFTISDDNSYGQVAYIIKLHQTSFRFTCMMNDSYSLSFLLIMAINLLILPLIGVAIIANLDQPLRLLPFVCFFNGIMVHCFVLFWPGQRVLDHSRSLHDDAWYTLPLHTKKLLLIFMARCSKPAPLSAGGLFLINFEVYAMIMKNALSYITVLASFR